MNCYLDGPYWFVNKLDFVIEQGPYLAPASLIEFIHTRFILEKNVRRLQWQIRFVYFDIVYSLQVLFATVA